MAILQNLMHKSKLKWYPGNKKNAFSVSLRRNNNKINKIIINIKSLTLLKLNLYENWQY